MMEFSRTDCARARESFSAELDGELPELERQRLSMHLVGCPDCAAWTSRVEDTTLQLRDVPLERPALVFARPQRARRWAASPAIAMASAAAVAATVVIGLGPQRGTVGGGAGRHQAKITVSRSTTNVVEPVIASGRLDTFIVAPSAPVRHVGNFRAI